MARVRRGCQFRGRALVGLVTRVLYPLQFSNGVVVVVVVGQGFAFLGPGLLLLLLSASPIASPGWLSGVVRRRLALTADIFVVLVADRLAIVAEYLTWPQPHRGSGIFTSHRSFLYPRSQRFRLAVALFLEIAESGCYRGQFVAVWALHRLGWFDTAGQSPVTRKKGNLTNFQKKLLQMSQCFAIKILSKSKMSFKCFFRNI